jgi:hypothetical protein
MAKMQDRHNYHHRCKVHFSVFPHTWTTNTHRSRKDKSAVNTTVLCEKQVTSILRPSLREPYRKNPDLELGLQTGL